MEADIYFITSFSHLKPHPDPGFFDHEYAPPFLLPCDNDLDNVPRDRNDNIDSSFWLISCIPSESGPASSIMNLFIFLQCVASSSIPSHDDNDSVDTDKLWEQYFALTILVHHIYRPVLDFFVIVTRPPPFTSFIVPFSNRNLIFSSRFDLSNALRFRYELWQVHGPRAYGFTHL